MLDPAVIKRRRIVIQQDAPCQGCGSKMSSCLAQRGKDPTAPPWFGCCARGLEMQPCFHPMNPAALYALIKEIESGKVRDVDEMLLDSLTERTQTLKRIRAIARSMPPKDFQDYVHSGHYYPEDED